MTQQQTHDTDSPNVKLIPPIIFYLCLLVGGVVEYRLGSDLPVHWSIHLGAGLILGVVGFWFMMWGHGLFRKLGTSEKTFQPSTLLVREGAYRHSRNPMYVGMVGFLLGIGLALGSVWMMSIGLALPFYLALYVVPREEAYMERRWGQEYVAYRQQVRRWL